MDKRFRSTPLLIALLTLIYYVAGRLGLSLALVNPSASAVWPPTGIALAAFLVFGNRVWPAILAGAFLVNVTTSGSVPASALIAVGNTLEGWVGAALVNRFAQGLRAFDSAPNVFRFTLMGGLIGPMVSATVGVTTLVLARLAIWRDAPPIWLTWWLGDATGALIVAPFLVLWAGLPKLDTRRARVLEAGALLACTALLGLATFGGFTPINARNYPIEYILLPVAVWSAYRFGSSGSASITVLLASIAVWGTLRGYGPFARDDPNTSLLLLQGYMAIVSVTGLVLAAMIARRAALSAENARLYAEAQHLNADLEQRIADRTALLAASNSQLQSEVLDRERAQSQLEDMQSRLRKLSARVQAAREEERASVAREIHDELGQQLTALKMDVAQLSRGADRLTTAELRAGMTEMSHALDDSIQTVRRIATDLRPAILDDFGLLAAIQWQLQEFQKRTGISGQLVANVEDLELKPEQATALFRLCQEALTNVARHAQATQVALDITAGPDSLVVEIRDNGRGISTGELDNGPSLGLLGMRERAQMLRGTLEIQGSPGHGTTIRIVVPLK